MTTVELAAPRIVDGIDARTYHADPALSSSQVRDLLVTPARYQWRRGHPLEPTRAMQIGTLVHTEVFDVGTRAWVTESEEWRTKDAKAEVAEAETNGHIAVRPSEWALIAGMAAAVRAHPLAGQLLNPERGTPERAIWWTDERTGTPCRALIDWSPANGRSLVDLKTTGDVAPEGLGRLFSAHGYPIQGAHYLRAAAAAGLVDKGVPFVFVLVSRDPPHDVVVARSDPQDLAWADDQCERAYEMWRDCTESGLWPGYSTDLITVTMPPWARRDAEEYP